MDTGLYIFIRVQFGINASMIGGLVFAAIFFILWVVLRKRFILIYPNSGAPMKISVSCMYL